MTFFAEASEPILGCGAPQQGDARALDAVLALGPTVGELVARRVLAFAALLRRYGFDMSLNRLIDTFRSLDLVDVLRREDFYLALRANFVSDAADLPVFDHAFSTFWLGAEDLSGQGLPPPCEGSNQDLAAGPRARLALAAVDQSAAEEGDAAATGEGQQTVVASRSYSAAEVLARKDFALFDDGDLKAMRPLLSQLARAIATKPSRRRHPARTGQEIDLRAALRANLKYAGDILELPRRQQKIRRTKLVLLCDVSGSMDRYSRFLIQFIYALQNVLGGVETFVFSTRLSRITHVLRCHSIAEALGRLGALVPDWSGGTNIGGSLRAFNLAFAPSVVTGRTVVLVLSDGWDLGDAQVLAREMARLRGRCHSLFWLNPLAGSPDYQPLAIGMKTALPYVDHFLPAHNLESLVNMIRVLRAVA